MDLVEGSPEEILCLEEPRGLCHLRLSNVTPPNGFLQGRGSPSGTFYQNPSHLRQEEVFTLWELLVLHQKDGLVVLISQDVPRGEDRKKRHG